MKKLLYISALIFCSNTYAECHLNTTEDYELRAIVKKEGWDFKNFNELCTKLNNANVSVAINQVSQFSDTQVSVSTEVRLYPIELSKKYKYKFLTQYSYMALNNSKIRTSKSEEKLMYEGANFALNGLIANTGLLDNLLKDIARIRELVKP